MTEVISVENVLRRCGDFGRFQLIHFIFLNLICIGSGINAFYYLFGVAEPAFRCRLQSDVWPNEDQFEYINSTHQSLIERWTSTTSKCNNINGSKCVDFVYDRSVFGRTFTEYSAFVCSNAVKRTWLSTVYQIGSCSVLISGWLGDKFGRQKVIQILATIVFVIPVLIQLFLQFIRMTLNVKFGLLLVNQFVVSADAYSIVFLLLLELTSSSHTSLTGNLAMVTYTLGEIFTAIFAYVARDWLVLKWLNSAYLGLILPYLYFVPESPYWLFTRKRYSELEVCLRKIAVTNGHVDSEWFPHYQLLIQNASEPVKIIEQRKRKRNRDLFPNLSIISLIAFVTMLLYIKISYGLGAMNDTFSPYWNIIIGAVVESIGYILATFLLTTRLGRKYTLMLFALLTSICVLVIPFITDTYPTITIIISQMGKLTISGAVSASWIYVPELLPLSMRGFGNALFVFVGRVGAILVPIVDVALGVRYLKITFYVYSALSVVMLLVVILLPETRNQSFNENGPIDNKVHQNTALPKILVE